MADIADLAEIREAKQRQDAIERIRHRPVETPLVNSDGQRLCRDCEEVIPTARIAAAPHAVRCVGCQNACEGMQ